MLLKTVSEAKTHRPCGRRSSASSWYTPRGIKPQGPRLSGEVRIAIMGAGHIGATLARHFVDAGHEVAVSNSRGPDTLEGLVDELGQGVQAMTTADAARFGDVVVVSIPFGRYRELPTEGVAGKVVIDTN